MKKINMMISLIFMLSISFSLNVFAQGDMDSVDTTADVVVDSSASAVADTTEATETAADVANTAIEETTTDEELSGHQVLMKFFIDGDPRFMSPILFVLIFGLAFCIERVISLSLASGNTKKLLEDVESNLAEGNVEGAKEVCKSSRSPVADIVYQGLERVKEGVEIVEKSVVAYGSVQMGRLESGLTWISLAIAIAPMLGFMGTVIGMILAFGSIVEAGNLSAVVIASDIKVALLTTVFGLISAIILQVFYNYIVSRIDSIVNDMEDASITFVDMLLKHNIVSKN